MAFDYYASGAETETTTRDNRSGFARYRILPRILRDISRVDTSTELLGASAARPPCWWS
jgi:isopentenyl diphosphate isomerase/L-lactate dehydrogenase-like FMN-dependent dehydrogenase